jgi:hypothetical protein
MLFSNENFIRFLGASLQFELLFMSPILKYGNLATRECRHFSIEHKLLLDLKTPATCEVKAQPSNLRNPSFIFYFDVSTISQ